MKDPIVQIQRYAHGGLKGERHIILDAQVIPHITAKGDLRVIQRKHLLERILNTGQERASIAQRIKSS